MYDILRGASRAKVRIYLLFIYFHGYLSIYLFTIFLSIYIYAFIYMMYVADLAGAARTKV